MFWKGFQKRASMPGVKALQPMSAAGKMVGNKPQSMVATVGAFKPNALPTGKPLPAAHNAAARLNNTALPTPAAPIANQTKVVAGMSS